MVFIGKLALEAPPMRATAGALRQDWTIAAALVTEPIVFDPRHDVFRAHRRVQVDRAVGALGTSGVVETFVEEAVRVDRQGKGVGRRAAAATRIGDRAAAFEADFFRTQPLPGKDLDIFVMAHPTAHPLRSRALRLKDVGDIELDARLEAALRQPFK